MTNKSPLDIIGAALQAAKCQTPYDGKLNAMAHYQYDVALVALDGLREQMEWRDISTAPKDGTWIVVSEMRGLYPYTAYFCTDAKGWFETNTHHTDHVDGRCNPTHWKPLDPPTAEKDDVPSYGGEWWLKRFLN